MTINDIENHLERADARIVEIARCEAVRERNRLIGIVIKTNVAIISILCVVYAIYMQF